MTGYVADLSWKSGARAIEKLDRLRSTMAVNVLTLGFSLANSSFYCNNLHLCITDFYLFFSLKHEVLQYEMYFPFLCGATAQCRPRPASLLKFRVSYIHSDTHTHTHVRSSERVTSSSQRPLPAEHTTNRRDKYPCPSPAESNPRSQHVRGCRPMP